MALRCPNKDVCPLEVSSTQIGRVPHGNTLNQRGKSHGAARERRQYTCPKREAPVAHIPGKRAAGFLPTTRDAAAAQVTQRITREVNTIARAHPIILAKTEDASGTDVGVRNGRHDIRARPVPGVEQLALNRNNISEIHHS